MKKIIFALSFIVFVYISSAYAEYRFSVSPLQFWFHTEKGGEETANIKLENLLSDTNQHPLDPNDPIFRKALKKRIAEQSWDPNNPIFRKALKEKVKEMSEQHSRWCLRESLEFEISFLPPDESGINLASFCKFGFDKIKLKKGEKGEIPIKIKVPPNAKGGSYIGQVKIRPIPPKGVAVKSTTSACVKIYLLVKGDDLKKGFSLTAKVGAGSDNKNPEKKFFLVESEIKNDGNVFFVATKLEGVIRNNGGKVADLSFRSQSGGATKTIMPEAGPKFWALVPELALGNYQAVVKGTCSYGGSDTEEKEVVVDFTVDPNISRLVWGKVIFPFKVEPQEIALALHPKAKKRVKYITLQNDSDVEMEVTEIRLPPFVELMSRDHPPFKVGGWKSRKIKIFVKNELNGGDSVSGEIVVATSDGCEHKIVVNLTKKGGSDDDEEERKGTDYFKSNRGNFLCWMR